MRDTAFAWGWKAGNKGLFASADKMYMKAHIFPPTFQLVDKSVPKLGVLPENSRTEGNRQG